MSSSYYPTAPTTFGEAAAAASSSHLSTSSPTPTPSSSSILHLNVGGTKFSTSRQTLLNSAATNPRGAGGGGSAGGGQHPPQDTFFTALLSGRVGCLRDESGAIFIDRDPDLFRVILNYLRTRTLSLNGVDVKQLLHEAEYYGIPSLVKQLQLCVGKVQIVSAYFYRSHSIRC